MRKIVISLGGSVIIPNKVDYKYLNNFKKIINKFCKKNKVVIITGGGSTARDYIISLGKVTNNDKLLSIVGIAATRLNSRLVGGIFGIHDRVPENLQEVKKLLKKRNLVVCGALGYKENMTSDGNAAEVAELIKADYFVNITNIKGLYNSNPLTNKKAKFIPEINFNDFDKMLSKIKFRPGQHFVLDQSAAKIIKRSKIKTITIGRDLKNLSNLLNGKKFIGTIIG